MLKIEIVKLTDPSLILTIGGVQQSRQITEDQAKAAGFVRGEDRTVRVADLLEELC